MEQDLVVEVREGNFKLNSPETKDRIQELLQHAGVSGNFSLLPGRGFRGSDRSDQIQIRGFESIGSILMKVQMTGKASKQEVFLTVPEIYRNEDFLKSLQEVVNQPVKQLEKSRTIVRKRTELPVDDNLSARKKEITSITEDDLEIMRLMVVELFADRAELEKNVVLTGIAGFNPDFVAEEILTLLLEKEYLFQNASMISVKKSEENSSAAAVLVQDKQLVQQEDHFLWLASIAEKAKRLAELREHLYCLEREDERFSLELQRITEELRRIREERENVSVQIETLADTATEIEKIKATLGFSF